MDIFINECSLHKQFFEHADGDTLFRVFLSVLNEIRERKIEFSLYQNNSMWHVYNAFPDQVLSSTLNSLRDKSLSTAVRSALFNKLNAKDWRAEQTHSSDDIFMCGQDFVTETSMAELAERKIYNQQLTCLLINFPRSKFSDVSFVAIDKNYDFACHIDCVDTKDAAAIWLRSVVDLEDSYDEESANPPLDRQTILCDHSRFERTKYLQAGRIMYREIVTGYYWYVDNLHFGLSAHLEVFNSQGTHMGEANLRGDVDTAKCDATKRIAL